MGDQSVAVEDASTPTNHVISCLEAAAFKLANTPGFKVVGFVKSALPAVLDAAAQHLQETHSRRLQLVKEAEVLRDRIRVREAQLAAAREKSEMYAWHPRKQACRAEADWRAAESKVFDLEAKLHIVTARRDALREQVGATFSKEQATWSEERNALTAERDA